MAKLLGKYIEDSTIALGKLADISTDTFIGRTTSGSGSPEELSKADALTILNVADGADVTDSTSVDNAGAVMETDYTANTILAATTTETPVVLTIPEQTIVGRITAGSIDALTATEVRTLISVEDGADVTDATNVMSSLDGATVPTATVAGTDKILIQDTDDSDNLKTVTAQAIADLGTGGTKIVEVLTIDATDITNKYSDDLTQTPQAATAVQVTPVGGIQQEYTVDFTIITDGGTVKRFNWDGLGLESLLAENDKVIVSYTY